LLDTAALFYLVRLTMTRAALFFVLASILMVGPHVWPPTRLSDFPYDFTDSYIFLWNFWWTKKAATDLVNPFYTDYLFYPLGTDLSFHSNPLTFSLISIPFQAAISGPEGLAIAFNTIVLASFILSGFGAYRLALYVTGSGTGALLSGLIFAFMPFRFLNMSRLHVLATELIPFYVLAFIRFLDQPSWTRAFAVGAWLSVCFYTSLEYALYLCIFSGLLLLYRVGLRQVVVGKALLSQLAAAAVVFTLFGSPLLLAQMTAIGEKRTDAEYPVTALKRWAPALLSFVTPTRYHPVYGGALRFAGEYGDDSGIHPPGMRSETYVGITTLFLALLGFAEARRQGSFFWGLSAIAFLLLTLGPYLRLTGAWQTDLPLPYHLFYGAIPPLRGSRDSTRFFPLLMLSMAVLSSFGLRSILQVCKSRTLRVALGSSFLALVLLEDLVPFPGMTGVAVDSHYRAIGREEGDFALIDLSFGKQAALAQTVHGRKITSGSLLVPRSTSVESALRVERDFRDPGEVLSLPLEERLTRLDGDRAEILSHRIGYVIYPGGTGPRYRLARLLGAQVTPRPPLVFCRFEPARW
jgi:hypothetical protein